MYGSNKVKDGGYKATTLQGSYAGKVRGTPNGSGDRENAPTPNEAPGSHTLCTQQKGGN